MKLLLDSHTFIWMMVAPEELSKTATKYLTDSKNELLLSSVSLWELVIKESLGKLSVPKKVVGLFKLAQERGLVSYFRIEPPHLAQLTKLAPHHRDPFDRLLVSQAIEENIPILTRDMELKKYKVKCLW